MSIKVGDFVVKKSLTTKPYIWRVVGESNVFADHMVMQSNGVRKVHHEATAYLRKATEQEKEVWRRIDIGAS